MGEVFACDRRRTDLADHDGTRDIRQSRAVFQRKAAGHGKCHRGHDRIACARHVINFAGCRVEVTGGLALDDEADAVAAQLRKNRAQIVRLDKLPRRFFRVATDLIAGP